ncbi:unnamed protein product [Chondrus crispus]|uniref:Uncharacterized protein n=1 Tax=Chondrus crispus TaxID=2769 RepID=R7QIN9_CHOCR|nr:unnamed protein product [Chondrus crispus]CDF37934.1 unnamed protein product [Chondrus crispus]|eukprot:XP_005717805.1 unnamed protein product [Chondrus crispus]
MPSRQPGSGNLPSGHSACHRSIAATPLPTPAQTAPASARGARWAPRQPAVRGTRRELLALKLANTRLFRTPQSGRQQPSRRDGTAPEGGGRGGRGGCLLALLARAPPPLRQCGPETSKREFGKGKSLVGLLYGTRPRSPLYCMYSSGH